MPEVYCIVCSYPDRYGRYVCEDCYEEKVNEIKELEAIIEDLERELEEIRNEK